MQAEQFGEALVLHLAVAGADELSMWADAEDNLSHLACELSALSVREAGALGRYWQHFCSLRIQGSAALNCLRHVRERTRREESLQCLLARGAPFALMSQVGHLSWREYRRRVAPEQRSGAGRPRLPNSREKACLDAAIGTVIGQRTGAEDASRPLDLVEWLLLSRLTEKIPLRVTWRYLSDCIGAAS